MTSIKYETARHAVCCLLMSDDGKVLAHVVAQAPDAPRSMPFEGELAWVKPEVLASGPFADYNQALFDHLNIRWRPGYQVLGTVKGVGGFFPIKSR